MSQSVLRVVGLGEAPLDAAAVFHHTSQTAAKEYERNDAERRLGILLAEHPEIASRR